MQRGDRQQLHRSILHLVRRRATDLESWLQSRGGAPDADLQEVEDAVYVLSRWSSWRRETNTETEDRMMSQLGQLPSTGRCDALGRLLVELPNAPPEDFGHFPLVVRTITNNGSVLTKTTESCSKPTSSSPSPTQRRDEENATQMGPMRTLADSVQRMQIGSGTTRLELPILTVEYRKASDSLIKGTNKLRMYLTASVKFLQAVGITNIPVYGVQTDGPIVVLPAVVLRDDNVRSLFTNGLR